MSTTYSAPVADSEASNNRTNIMAKSAIEMMADATEDLTAKSLVSFSAIDLYTSELPQDMPIIDDSSFRVHTPPSDGGTMISDELPQQPEHSEKLGATDVILHSPFRMGPPHGVKFPLAHVRVMVEYYLKQKLMGRNYTQPDGAKWAAEFADEINLQMKGNCLQDRYKHVVSICLYQQTGAGCFYGARAIWDGLTDDYLAFQYEGNNFMCLCTIFGIYQY